MRSVFGGIVTRSTSYPLLAMDDGPCDADGLRGRVDFAVVVKCDCE